MEIRNTKFSKRLRNWMFKKRPGSVKNLIFVAKSFILFCPWTEIPQDWLNKWMSAKPFEDFALPLPNIYLTTDFSMLPNIMNLPEYPQKVVDTPLVELWYRKDQKFKLPLAYYFFYLITPKAIESPLRWVYLSTKTRVRLFWRFLNIKFKKVSLITEIFFFRLQITVIWITFA